MKREARLRRFQNRFLLMRLVFILSVAVLGACEVPQILPVLCLVGLMLVAEVYLASLEAFRFCHDIVLASALVGDTVIVSGMLVLASANTLSFVLFFAALIVVAYVENLIGLAILTALMGCASLFISLDEMSWARVPFLVAAGQYYAYLISGDKLLDPTPSMRIRRPGHQDVHVIDHGGGLPTPAGALPTAASPTPHPASPWDTDDNGAVDLSNPPPEAQMARELSRLSSRSR